MSKHTPGPWKSILEAGSHIRRLVIDKEGFAVCVATAPLPGPDHATAQANARLIAAAPALLEAAKALQLQYFMDAEAQEWAALRAAIREADPQP